MKIRFLCDTLQCKVIFEVKKLFIPKQIISVCMKCAKSKCPLTPHQSNVNQPDPPDCSKIQNENDPSFSENYQKERVCDYEQITVMLEDNSNCFVEPIKSEMICESHEMKSKENDIKEAKNVQDKDRHLNMKANQVKDEKIKTKSEKKKTSEAFCSLIYCVTMCGLCTCIFNLITNNMTMVYATFRLSGCLLYVADIITDIISGLAFVKGERIDNMKFGNSNFTNYTDEVCDNFDDYSHPIWGYLVIAISWAPVLSFIPRMVSDSQFIIRSKKNTKKYYGEKSRELIPEIARMNRLYGTETKSALIALCIIPFWPMVGCIM